VSGTKPVVGWREWVALPDLGVAHVKAKIDTGARTSALHAWDVEFVDDTVRFVVHPYQDDDETVVCSQSTLVDEREVRSSNGETELRPVIQTPIVIGDLTATVELTLTRRDDMGFRLLLGRQALRAAGYVVDPARSFTRGGSRFAPP